MFLLLLNDLSSYTHTCINTYIHTQLILSKVPGPLLAQVRGITFLLMASLEQPLLEKAIKPRLPAPQFVLVQQMKPWEISISSIGSGNNNNKAEGEYSTIPGRRSNQAKREGSIVFGHNGRAKHSNAFDY